MSAAFTSMTPAASALPLLQTQFLLHQDAALHPFDSVENLLDCFAVEIAKRRKML
jgi:hypothetical protein